jgi:hypothetical protein
MILQIQDKFEVNNKILSNIEIEVGIGKPNIQLIYK